MTDITWIIIGFVIMLAGFFFGFIRPWLQSKLDPQQLEMLRQYAKVAVSAAEQIITITTGKDKKAYAMDLVKNFLAKYHLTFDDATVSAVIEEKVYEMNKEKREFEAEHEHVQE